MTGRPDYDAGDLIALVKLHPGDESFGLSIGQVFVCLGLIEPGDYPGWSVILKGKPAPGPGWQWNAACFRKVPPKPADFWTRDIPADIGADDRELVDS
jgi:hypothetical protein